MKRIVVALLSVSLLAACGSDSKKSTTSTAAPDGGSVPTSEGGEAGLVDPSVTEGCSILTLEQTASILGEAEGHWNSNALHADELAECQWYTADGRSIAFQIFMVDLPADNLPTDGEQIAVGNGGVYRESSGIPSLDADIRGWWVRAVGVQGTVTRDQVIALAQLLDSVLIERSASSVAGGGSTDGGGGEGAIGTLTDMSVTIDAPANLAGTMTLADLQAQATSFSMCGGPWTLNSFGKLFTVMYEFGVMTGDVASPAPVVGFSLSVDGDYTGPGVYVAQMRFATNTAEVSGVGSVTVNPDQLSGSFTYSDASGTVTGGWTCEGS